MRIDHKQNTVIAEAREMREEIAALRQWNKTLRRRVAAVPSITARLRMEIIELCADVAENVRGGYSVNIREDESEPEFVKDVDGPWVLNADVAKAIRSIDAAVVSDDEC